MIQSSHNIKSVVPSSGESELHLCCQVAPELVLAEGLTAGGLLDAILEGPLSLLQVILRKVHGSKGSVIVEHFELVIEVIIILVQLVRQLG